MLCQRLGFLARAPLASLLIVLALFTPGPAWAQSAKSFRVVWNVEKSNPTSTEISGSVSNDSRLEAYDVYVTAEALDEKGKVLARGLTHVSPMLRPAASEKFVAKVPVVPGITSYRVLVSSFRFGLGTMQTP